MAKSIYETLASGVAEVNSGKTEFSISLPKWMILEELDGETGLKHLAELQHRFGVAAILTKFYAQCLIDVRSVARASYEAELKDEAGKPIQRTELERLNTASEKAKSYVPEAPRKAKAKMSREEQALEILRSMSAADRQKLLASMTVK